MGFTATQHHCSSIAFCNSPSFLNKTLLAGHRVPRVSMPRLPLSTSFPCFSRRRRGNTADRAITTTSSSSKKKKNQQMNDTMPEEGLDEDAFEALFHQLEEDLKNDDGSLDDDDDEITEEELAMFEQELEEALAEDDDLSGVLNATTDDAQGGQGEGQGEEQVEEVSEDEDEDEDEDEEAPLKLKGWQLRRLAYALKAGRRKTSIKSLAAEVCLDRSIVLELLRDPPPSLLTMSASLPDKLEPEPEPMVSMPLAEELKPTISTLETEDTQSVSSNKTTKSAESDTKVKPPIHVQQRSWSSQKRLKKVQVETLESVYRRTKRPTNAMVSSIVSVTNLPRKRIVKWFEDKRAEEGVPDHRQPYQRSASENSI